MPNNSDVSPLQVPELSSHQLTPALSNCIAPPLNRIQEYAAPSNSAGSNLGSYHTPPHPYLSSCLDTAYGYIPITQQNYLIANTLPPALAQNPSTVNETKLQNMPQAIITNSTSTHNVPASSDAQTLGVKQPLYKNPLLRKAAKTGAVYAGTAVINTMLTGSPAVHVVSTRSVAKVADKVIGLVGKMKGKKAKGPEGRPAAEA